MLLSEDNVYQVIKVYVVQMLHNQVLCTCYLLVLKLHKDVVPEIMDIYTPLSHLVQRPKPQNYRCICVCVYMYVYILGFLKYDHHINTVTQTPTNINTCFQMLQGSESLCF